MRGLRLIGCKLQLAASVLLGAAFSLSNLANAQQSPPACSYLMQGVAEGRFQLKDIADIRVSVVCFWEVSLQSQPQLLRSKLRAQAAVQKSAATTQSGAPSGGNGTTSAVSKPNTPLASLASEYGGITSSSSNQTMTIQTTLDGIPSVLGSKGFLPYCWTAYLKIPGCVSAPMLEWLNRFGLGVTANTSSASQNVSGTASPSQGTAQQASLKTAGSTAPSLSSTFAKFTIWRGEYKLPATGPNGAKVAAAEEKLANALKPPGPANGNVGPPPEVLQRYQDWQARCIENNPSFTPPVLADKKRNGELVAKYYSQVVRVLFYNSTAVCPPDSPPALTAPEATVPTTLTPWQQNIVNAVEKYVASVSSFQAQLDQMLRSAAAPVLSFEYDFNTPTNQPTTSTYKLVGSKAFGPKICPKAEKDSGDKGGATAQGSRFTETINIGGNAYNSTPSVPGAGKFRDLQAGTETDIAFCTSTAHVIGSFLGNSTLGLTYYYQDQTSPSILKVTPGTPLPGISITGLASTTSSVFAMKGPINFVQLKYGLGTGKNVKFPIAVSWSNRTDLITHSLWSAQFGVSYDFSSLFNSSSSTDTSTGK